MTDETIRKLRDPVAVHVAMLRGQIAVPPLAELPRASLDCSP